MPHIDQVHIDNTYYDVQDIRIPATTSSDSGKVIGVDSSGNYILINGGGGSQSDWSQNTPTSPSYVRNRTHWEEEGSTTVIIPEAPSSGHYSSSALSVTSNQIAYKFVTISNQDFLDYIDGVTDSKTDALLNVLSYCGAGSASVLFDSTNKPENNPYGDELNTAFIDMDAEGPSGFYDIEDTSTYGLNAWWLSGGDKSTYIGNFSCYLRFLCALENLSASVTNNLISTFETYYESYGGSDGTENYCILPFGDDTYLIVYDYSNDTSLQIDFGLGGSVYYYYNLKAEEITPGVVHELDKKYYNHDYTWNNPTYTSGSVSVTFDSNTSGSQYILADENIVLNLVVKNKSDNYIFIQNDGTQGTSYSVAINSVLDDSGNSCTIAIPTGGISVSDNKICVLKVVVDNVQNGNSIAPVEEDNSVIDVSIIEGLLGINSIDGELGGDNGEGDLESIELEENSSTTNVERVVFITYIGELTFNANKQHNSVVNSIIDDVILP